MAAVLAATGVFVYLRFESELDATVNAGLRSRAVELASVVRQADAEGNRRLVGKTDSFAEVLTAGGRVVDSSQIVGSRVLLSPAQLQRALQEPLLIDRGKVPGTDEPARLLATPASSDGERRVAVVGASTADQVDSLGDLRQLLLLGEPAALLLASIAAYWVAAAALRPVEAMRVRAASIATAAPDERLPVPPSGDEIARLGETLNEMLDRLGDAIEHERAFVADASHELRTPLAILSTELELALAEGRSPQELRAALASAAEETDRLTQLSEDLLTIAQTEGGELPLRIGPVELGEVLEGVRLRFSRRAAEEGREIVVVGGELELASDRLRLDQAVGSVVDNALRYGAGTVTIAASRADGAVEIAVSDEGPGFPPGFLDRAFERFSRASSSRRDGGSGLGLAIVRTVARAHGGEARAANRDGGGAEVTLTIPDRVRSDAAAEAATKI
ncbi:MAG: HAMP domain-containing histidine kinase [Actinobacteria bacterium]|nr:HAMP domain-containing histidine kinase [Actinomycetota bacterium]